MNLLLRGFVAAAVIVVSAFATLIAYRHLVPKEFPRLISRDHEVRRQLTRAERINLRTGVNCEEGILLPHLGQQPSAVLTPPETLHRVYGAGPAVSTVTTRPATADLERSTVLNL
ncbi:MAG: hypothetical protein ACM3SP_20865 [Chloroflexota bacterium]